MIGVAGGREAAQRAVEALESAGEPAAAVSPDALDATELVVALEEEALAEFAGAEPDVPVLPTSRSQGPGAEIDVQWITRQLDRVRDGSAELRSEPLLAVTANGDPIGRSCLDVMLVRSEPGRISEYSWTAGRDRARFRADGVVLATPRGSHGYAHAAGGPRLGLDAAAVVIVPVAAFGLGAASWVQDPTAGIDLEVEREEGAVSLLIDGRERRRFSGRSTVSVRRQGSLQTVDPSA